MEMSSPTNLQNNFYGLFKSHLLVEVLALPEDSPPIRALMEGASIDLLIDFLLQPHPTMRMNIPMLKKGRMGVPYLWHSIPIMLPFLWLSPGGAIQI